MKTIYDKAYFIAKFEAIPEELWAAGAYNRGNGVCCALGHCGYSYPIFESPEALALARLFQPAFNDHRGSNSVVSVINDGDSEEYAQPTPKARILAALHDLP